MCYFYSCKLFCYQMKELFSNFQSIVHLICILGQKYLMAKIVRAHKSDIVDFLMAMTHNNYPHKMCVLL